MRTIALEEHCLLGPGGMPGPADGPMAERLHLLREVGPGRLADMDASGIDLQVLSEAALGAPPDAAAATAANDRLAAAVAAHPARFAAFASLPAAPAAAADELERAVTRLGLRGALINGQLGGRFLDDPAAAVVLARAEALGVPLYLHPAEPPAAVRDAYYAGFAPPVTQLLATAGWGWHIESGLHVLRLILAGVFDRFPRLQVIVGHMGEALPFMLARSETILDPVAGLSRPLGAYFRDHVHVTTSGFFTVPPLLCALLVLGADRILFSVDYPFSPNARGRAFLETAPLAPADREKIAHGNAERLLRL